MLEEILRTYILISKEYIGKGVAPISYRAGESVGEIYAKKSMQEIISEFRKIGMNLISKTTQNEIRVIVSNSFEAKIHGKTKSSNCHMLRGFFTAIWRSHLKSQFVQCEELECLGKGDKNCLFIIKDVPPLISITPIRERLAPFEIIERSHIEIPTREEVFP